jgi:hypothetical protein
MFEWCSSSEMTISSPGPSRWPKACATRFSASVAFFTNTTSSGEAAPMNAATLARAASYAAVDSVPSVCTERATLALCRS